MKRSYKGSSLATALLVAVAWLGSLASTQPAKAATTNSTQLVSVSTSGTSGNYGSCCEATISNDHRYVAFSSNATNLVSSNPTYDHVYFRDLQAGMTTLIPPAGMNPKANYFEAMTPDARYILFNAGQEYVYDRNAGTTQWSP